MGVCKYGIGQLNVGLDSLLHHPTHLNGTHVVLFQVMLRQQDHDLKHIMNTTWTWIEINPPLLNHCHQKYHPHHSAQAWLDWPSFEALWLQRPCVSHPEHPPQFHLMRAFVTPPTLKFLRGSPQKGAWRLCRWHIEPNRATSPHVGTAHVP